MRSRLLWVPLGQRPGAQGLTGPCPCPPPFAWAILGSPGGHQEEGGWHRDTTGPPVQPSGTPPWTAWPGPEVPWCSHTGHGGRAFPRAKFFSFLQSMWGLARSKARAGVTSRSLAAARGGGLRWIIPHPGQGQERERAGSQCLVGVVYSPQASVLLYAHFTVGALRQAAGELGLPGVQTP